VTSNDKLDINLLTMIHYECDEEWRDGFTTCAVTEIAITATQGITVRKNADSKGCKRHENDNGHTEN